MDIYLKYHPPSLPAHVPGVAIITASRVTPLQQDTAGPSRLAEVVTGAAVLR